MIDVESLGNEGLFIVTEVAIVPFNIENKEKANISECLNIRVNVDDGIINGFKIDKKTVDWWINEDKIKYESMLVGGHSLKESCSIISEYLESIVSFDRCWATATMDYQAISNMFSNIGLNNPIPFNKRFCARTVRLIDNMINKTQYVRTNNHTAIDDCYNQIDILINQMNRILIV